MDFRRPARAAVQTLVAAGLNFAVFAAAMFPSLTTSAGARILDDTVADPTLAAGTELRVVESYRKINGIDGLGYVNMAAISPDGRNLYAVGRDQDALAVFDLDPATGALSFVEVYRDGVDGFDGLRGPQWAAVSPDGRRVYVAATGESAIGVFSREPESGKLRFLGAVRNVAGGPSRIAGPRSLAVSPDGAFVYASSVGSSSVIVLRTADGEANDSLTYVEEIETEVLENARGVVVSPDGAYVYVASMASDTVSLFQRDPETGRLTPREAFAADLGEDGDSLSGVATLTFSPDGRHLYAVADFSSEIAVFARDDATGSLLLIDRVGIDDFPSSSLLSLSPDGTHLYSAGGIFARDAETGKLTQLADAPSTGGRSFLLGFSMSPDGAFVYVTDAESRAITAWERNSTTGLLALIGRAQQFGARHLAVSPDGRDVYVAGEHAGLMAHFARAAPTGKLTPIAVHSGSEDFGEHVTTAISPDGRHVYVVSLPKPDVAIYHRERKKGRLAYIDTQMDVALGQGTETNLAFSPDGRYLYTELSVLARDASSGLLEGVQSVPFRSSGPLVISPDGFYAYAPGQGGAADNNSVGVLSRDPGSGRLELVNVVFDVLSASDGASQCISDLAVSPDGGNLYVLGLCSPALATYRRSPQTGELDLLDDIDDGPTQRGAGTIAVSANGNRVYIAKTDRSLAVYERAPTTGMLTLIEVLRGRADGVPQMYQNPALAISPDSRHVYVIGDEEDSVVVFEVPGATPCAGDCYGNGQVSIDELIVAVRIALGNLAGERCRAADGNADGIVSIDELIDAVRSALRECT